MIRAALILLATFVFVSPSAYGQDVERDLNLELRSSLLGQLRAVTTLQRTILVHIAVRDGTDIAKTILSSARDEFTEHLLNISEDTKSGNALVKATLESFRKSGYLHFDQIEQWMAILEREGGSDESRNP